MLEHHARSSFAADYPLGKPCSCFAALHSQTGHLLLLSCCRYSLQVDEQAQQRLGGLTELYNVAEDAKTQHMLLQQAIAYATKANLANLLGPVIKVRKRVCSQFFITPWACHQGKKRMFPPTFTSDRSRVSFPARPARYYNMSCSSQYTEACHHNDEAS